MFIIQIITAGFILKVFLDGYVLPRAFTKGIFIDHINGEREHIQALISLSKNQLTAEVMQYITGESSF